jgi:hypothetical protein
MLDIREQIQCIAANKKLYPSLGNIRVSFGSTQYPELWDYADGVDTMKFLIERV